MAQVFQRSEKKYMVTPDCFELLFRNLQIYMQPDKYGVYTICNVYYDTPHFDLIRRSIEKPAYKEKLRLRSYGIPGEQDTVFLEMKKKYRGVVFKRREALPYAVARDFADHGIYPAKDTQIMRELAYFMQYHGTKPQVYLAYDRVALAGREDPLLRITFDSGIRYRLQNPCLTAYRDSESHCDYLLPKEGNRIMEIKANGGMPMWLVRLLGDYALTPTSYSKYGMIYKTVILPQQSKHTAPHISLQV